MARSSSGAVTLIKTFGFLSTDGTQYDPATVAVDASGTARSVGTHGGVLKTQASTPLASLALAGFQAFTTKDSLVRYRLHDGTTSYVVQAGVWAPVVDTIAWNTEVEIAAAIATFPSPRSFGVVVQIQSGGAVSMVKVGYTVRVFSFAEDIVYRSLIRDLKAKFLPVTDTVHKMAVQSSTIDVGAVVTETRLPLNVVDVDGVFNLTDDPGQYQNLAASYSASTKVVTLGQPVPLGKQMLLALVYQPEFIVEMVSPDFQQIEKIPAFIVSDITEVESSPLPHDEWIVNKADGTAMVLPAPYRSTLRFSVTLMAPGGVDLLRMASMMKRYVLESPILRSHAIDEGYRLFLRDEFTSTSSPGPQGIHTATARFDVVDVLEWKIPSRAANFVKRLRPTSLLGR